MNVAELGSSSGRALDEFEAKRLLVRYGVPCVLEALARDTNEAVAIAERIGFPVAVKGCGESLLHKTEMGLVVLDLGSAEAVRVAADRVLDVMQGRGRLLVQKMVGGERELLIGMSRDPQFGPVVTFGLGGVFAEAFADVAMRVAPVEAAEAEAMLDEIRATRLLGPLRGMPAVDRVALVRAIVGVARLALERADIREIDINPLVVSGADPIAVDALIVLDGDERRA